MPLFRAAGRGCGGIVALFRGDSEGEGANRIHHGISFMDGLSGRALWNLAAHPTSRCEAGTNCRIDGNSFIDENRREHEIRHFLTRDGKDLYSEWHRRLRDTNAKIAIDRRINRIELGNFGDHKYCRDGVWELRIDIGPGYRVYYAISGAQVILLLCGGDKRTQSADIDRACEYWQDWRRRGIDERQKS